MMANIHLGFGILGIPVGPGASNETVWIGAGSRDSPGSQALKYLLSCFAVALLKFFIIFESFFGL